MQLRNSETEYQSLSQPTDLFQPAGFFLFRKCKSSPVFACYDDGYEEENIMKLMLRYLWKHKWLFLLNFICSFGFAAAELGIPTILGAMVDGGIEQGNPSALYSGFGHILLVAFAGTIGMIVMGIVSSRLSTSIVYEIRRDLFNHASTFSVAELDHFGVSSMITRTGSDAYQILMFLNAVLKSSLIAPVMLAVSVFLVVQTSLPLSMYVLGTIPAILLGVIFVFRVAGPLSEKQQKSIDQINEILRENMSGIRVIRAFNNQKKEEKRFAKENQNYRTISEKLFKLMNLTDPAFFFLMNIASMLIYWNASKLIDQGSLQIGQLMMFVEYLFHCMMSVLVLCMVFMMYPRASVSAKRIQEVLDTEPSIQTEGAGEKPGDIETLEFRDVCFAYPGSEKHSLKDISFRVHKGQKIAVIGATGSGKSSLIRLINRFYDPSCGSILINGKPISEYDLFALRDQIAMVSQKAHMFAGTIEDNIRFGNRSASGERISNAVRIAQAETFIQERENGLSDWISEEGTNLSGGQKQRLSIARAIASDPSLLILDDSFSALDLKTDSKLRKALEPLRKNSIFLVVAQRITSIIDADLILVLDHGRIAASGTHSELYRNSELYREIVLSQMSEQEAKRYE